MRLWGGRAVVLADLQARTFVEAVQEELLDGVRSGVNGTPTFFIDGDPCDGDWREIEELAEAIERASGIPLSTR